VLAQPVADAFAGAALDAPELFDVDVDELPGPFALIALSRLQAQPSNRPIPILVRIPDTVETGMASSSAISGPVKRSRRNAAIASIRCSSVRLATRSGAEL
jgi:hypothetical protein